MKRERGITFSSFLSISRRVLRKSRVSSAALRSMYVREASFLRGASSSRSGAPDYLPPSGPSVAGPDPPLNARTTRLLKYLQNSL